MASYTSQYPPEQNGTYVKTTTVFEVDAFDGYFATNPANSVVGAWRFNSWLAGSGQVTNNRFHIDLGAGKIIRRVYYENGHNGSGYDASGLENFTLWGSNEASAFAELTYATDTGWTQLTTSQNTFDRHPAANVADPKYITVTNTTSYRYYAFKIADNYGEGTFCCVRRIELQTEDGYGASVGNYGYSYYYY
jgi:hypothetical protein